MSTRHHWSGYVDSSKTRAQWAEGFHDELNGHVFDLERDGLRQVVPCLWFTIWWKQATMMMMTNEKRPWPCVRVWYERALKTTLVQLVEDVNTKYLNTLYFPPRNTGRLFWWVRFRRTTSWTVLLMDFRVMGIFILNAVRNVTIKHVSVTFHFEANFIPLKKKEEKKKKKRKKKRRHWCYE